VTTGSVFEFDEQWYLENNDDVAAAVANGDWPSGYMHFCTVGRSRGRVGGPPVDEEWYVTTYPLVAKEIAADKAAGARDHYYRIGRYRGYLRSARARRPENPAGFRSRYGGLWTDQGNALDIVAGRLDLGMITPEQADLSSWWINDGYVVIENAIAEDVLDRALADMDRAYEGGFPDLKFNIHGVGQNQYPRISRA
jgi:hypothetical protein